MSWLKRHTLTAAVVSLLIAFALWHFYPGVPAQWVFLGLGGVLLLLSLALNTGEARSAMGTRTARYGAGAAVMLLLALGIVVAANAISLRHSVRWDFTENKRNSVSPQTIQVLRTLKAPVSAIAFFRSDTPGKKTAEDLLTQYATYSRGKFTWRLEDTDRAPALARQYGGESYGTVVLEGGPAGQTRTEKVQDAEEEKLTLAQQRLQAKVESFRTRKETIKATYTAAEAQTRINEAMSGIGEEMGDVGMAIQRAEDKTATMQARAGAIDELIAAGVLDDASSVGAGDDISRELEAMSSQSEVETELMRLKGLSAPSTPDAEFETSLAFKPQGVLLQFFI